jgi:hypothetical protein
MANKLEETTQKFSRLASKLTNKLYTNRTNCLIHYIVVVLGHWFRLSLWLLVAQEVH